ncbi:MAG: MYXO-CTERM sorting domain-containing protein [Phycisphaerales bacterium]
MKKVFGFGVATTMVIGGAASADVLYDNPVGGSGTIVNQEFADAAAYSTYLVADFNVPGALGYNLTSVVAPMTVNALWGGITTARLHLFSVTGALPDNVLDDPTVSMIVPVSYDVQTGVLSTVGLFIPAVAPGNYWIGLTAIGEFGVFGQAFTLEGLNANGNPDAVRNPGAAPAFPFGPDWGAIQDFSVIVDFALTVEGDEVPAPGALALLGVAGLVTRRRRRR